MHATAVTVWMQCEVNVTNSMGIKEQPNRLSAVCEREPHTTNSGAGRRGDVPYENRKQITYHALNYAN